MQRAPRGASPAFVRAALLVVFAASPVRAQRWSDLVPAGERVRVRTQTKDEIYVGMFRPSLTDSLNVVVTPGDRYNEPIAIRLPSSSVRTVDVSEGYARVTRGLAGFVVGAVLGGVLGHIIGGIGACPPPNASTPQQCYAASSDTQFRSALFTIGGAGAGAVLGVVVGERNAPEKWRNVYTDRGARPAP